MPKEPAHHISLDAIMNAMKKKVSGEFNLVIGIENGGLLPACLLARWLKIPLKTFLIRFRDADHRPLTRQPQLLTSLPSCELHKKKILLVDDVAKTGATLERARKEIPEDATVTTLVISGKADISLLGEHKNCLHWPWD